MSPNNVAIYGGLTALATFDRTELLKQVVIKQNRVFCLSHNFKYLPKVISSTQFKLFLELEPQLREVLQCFYDSRYGHCLKLLEDMKDNLLLDLYLAPHIQTLFSMIRFRHWVDLLVMYTFSRQMFAGTAGWFSTSPPTSPLTLLRWPSASTPPFPTWSDIKKNVQQAVILSSFRKTS